VQMKRSCCCDGVQYSRRWYQCVQHPGFHTFHPIRNVIKFLTTRRGSNFQRLSILNSPGSYCESMSQLLDLPSSSKNRCGSRVGRLDIPTSQHALTEPPPDLLNLLSNRGDAVLTLQNGYTDMCKLGQPEPIEMEFAEIIFIELDEVLGCSTESTRPFGRPFGRQQMELQSSEPGQPVQISNRVSAHERSL
jgi:hypothetical protein